jgi:hypothetical protein
MSVILPDHDSVKDYPFGYYQVGSNYFTNKSEALAVASSSGVKPQWNFFNDVWDQQDWTGDVEEDLYDLYQSRARQLREKYDYICLAFSGGSDSTTMLDAFIDSGSHIDEIMVRWPIKATAGYAVSQDRASSNILSEWALTIQPLLDRYQQLLGPCTKINIIDWSDRVISVASSEESVWYTQDHFNPTTYIKHSIISDQTRRSLESGKSTCVVYGIDRPSIAKHNRQVFCFFQDSSAHTTTSLHYDQYVEFFYWSRDFPTIVPCQARIIYQHLLKNPKLFDLVDQMFFPGVDADIPRLSFDKIMLWEDLVRHLVYPRYMKQKWFQAHKSGTRMFADHDSWVFNNPSTFRYVDSWNLAVRDRLSSIDQRYIDRKDGQISGYLKFFGSVHRLGPVPVEYEV